MPSDSNEKPPRSICIFEVKFYFPLTFLNLALTLKHLCQMTLTLATFNKPRHKVLKVLLLL